MTTVVAHEWRALGTYVELAMSDARVLGPATAYARDVLACVDRGCSRFRADSDLNRVNASGGRPTVVGPTLANALRVALDAAGATDGLVTPLVGEVITRLGYDRTFAELTRADAGREAGPEASHPVPDWREIDLEGTTVTLPVGARLDLGATAKAWASDLIATGVAQRWGVGVIVNLGGDIRVAGDGPPWPIAISEHPDGTTAPTQIMLAAGGLATSTTRVRRWSAGRVERHHLVDPRSGLPARTPWRTVTATGPTATAANMATTAAIVLGEEAPTWLAARGVAARLVGDETVVSTPGWPSDPDVEVAA